MKTDRGFLKNMSMFALLITMLFGIIYLGLHFRKLGEQLDYQAPVGSPAIPMEKAGPSHKVYVPAYSHIFTGHGEPTLLAVTLSIRNTDSSHSIIVTSVQYYDSKGSLVREYLENPLELNALASTEFFVEEMDRTGGAGANYQNGRERRGRHQQHAVAHRARIKHRTPERTQRPGDVL